MGGSVHVKGLPYINHLLSSSDVESREELICLLVIFFFWWLAVGKKTKKHLCSFLVERKLQSLDF